MYQQINLYQPIFRKQRHIFSGVSMFQATGVIALALLLAYTYGLSQVLGLEAEVVQFEQREQAYADQLARLDTTEAIARRTEVEAELRALGEILIEQQQLIDVLRDNPLGNTSGFSDRLAALARQHREGLWLTRIALNGGSGEMQLAGVSVDPALLPEYLQGLGEEGGLQGQRFDILPVIYYNT